MQKSTSRLVSFLSYSLRKGLTSFWILSDAIVPSISSSNRSRKIYASTQSEKPFTPSNIFALKFNLGLGG